MNGNRILYVLILATLTSQFSQVSAWLFVNPSTPEYRRTTPLVSMNDNEVTTESSIVSTQRTGELGDFSQPSTGTSDTTPAGGVSRSTQPPNAMPSTPFPRPTVSSASPRTVPESTNPNTTPWSVAMTTQVAEDRTTEVPTTMQETTEAETTTKFDWRQFIDRRQTLEKVTPYQRRTYPRENQPYRSPTQWKKGSPRSENAVVTCRLSAQPGYCYEAFGAWYYNERRQECEWFQYTGCEGNANRFASRVTCENFCIEDVPDMCSGAVCGKYLTCKLRQDEACIEMVNGNRDPREVCPPKQPVCAYNSFVMPPRFPNAIALRPPECLEAPDRGTCWGERSPVQRYYFDSSINTCKLFYFSQCGGGDNRFPNKGECMNHCAI